MKNLFAILVSCALSACGAAPAPSLPDSLHWFRNSAEQKAVYVQTYRAAQASVRQLSAGLAPQSWGVILDVDETVLDNSDYQQREKTADAYDPEIWNAWVMEGKAPLLPGAKAFIDTVRELQGRVSLVTNRTQAQCAATAENLRQQGIGFERVLCDAAGDGKKTDRFNAVIAGSDGVPAMNVLIWVGDNIQDFPSLTQAAPGDFTPFGVRYFALPNPWYGSWQDVEPR